MLSRLAAASALVLTLSACGGSDGSDSDSDRPEFARNPGAAGAQQFADLWVDTLNQATETGDTEELRSLAAPDCETCEVFPAKLEEIYAEGGSIETEDWEIVEMVPEAGSSDDAATVLVTVQIPPQSVVASEGAEPTEVEGGRQAFRMVMERTDGDWFLQEITPR